jgi:hypothetical protein
MWKEVCVSLYTYTDFLFVLTIDVEGSLCKSVYVYRLLFVWTYFIDVEESLYTYTDFLFVLTIVCRATPKP